MNQETNQGIDGTKSRYIKEKYVNSLITNGDVEKLKDILETVTSRHVGDTSQNPFRQQLYDCIIGIAMAARAAMEGGMSEEEAYQLGDAYIREADNLTSPEKLWTLYNQMVLDFGERVQVSRANHRMSEAVMKGIDYIEGHLHFEMTLKEIADYAKLSETYFSALFRKETGETVTSFIQRKKIEEAKNMLQYSEESLLEISQVLGFCSQSHFSKTFHKFTGTTPGQYRKQNFKRSW